MIRDKLRTFEEIKKILKRQKPVLKEKYKVTQVGIFGSYCRGEQKQESDVDVLIDYKKVPSLITLIQLEDYLSDILGLKVDLITKKGIKPELKAYILKEVVYL